jgi:hypothetical protein
MTAVIWQKHLQIKLGMAFNKKGAIIIPLQWKSYQTKWSLLALEISFISCSRKSG